MASAVASTYRANAGSTARLAVAFMTSAIESYQAIKAVTRPEVANHLGHAIGGHQFTEGQNRKVRVRKPKAAKSIPLMLRAQTNM